LEELGFAWNIHDVRWRRNLHGLQEFKRIYGHVMVPQKFTIPDKDPRWPPELWKLKLGGCVADLRHRTSTIQEDKRRELDALGFLWIGRAAAPSGVNNDDDIIHTTNIDKKTRVNEVPSLAVSRRERKRRCKARAQALANCTRWDVVFKQRAKISVIQKVKPGRELFFKM
jgi:hypothetical protein